MAKTEKLIEAATSGDADAQCQLGEMYEFGRGVPKNVDESIKWYRMAAEQGSAEAQFALGCSYNDGRGVSKDQTKAVKWFQLAEEQAHPDAVAALGYAFHYGEGVPQDFGKAEELYLVYKEHFGRGEFDGGWVDFELGKLYLNEIQNAEQAFWCLWDAARKGEAGAQHLLGDMYATGRVVSQDLSVAYMCFDNSAKNSIDSDVREQAVAFKEALAKKMNLAQIEEAEQLISDWERQRGMRLIPHIEFNNPDEFLIR